MPARVHKTLANFVTPRVAKNSRALSGVLRFGPRKDEVTRPEGLVIWVHVYDQAGYEDAKSILTYLLQQAEQTVLLTSNLPLDDPDSRSSAPNLRYQCLGRDHPRTAHRLMLNWAPDIGLFLSSQLMPALIFRAHDVCDFLVLAQFSHPDEADERVTTDRGSSALLSCFDEIIPQTAGAQDLLLKLGYEGEKMRCVGPVRPIADTEALPFVQEERGRIARQLGGRPVWLAAGVTHNEADLLIEAQRSAERRAPRLLCILEPDDPDSAAEFLSRMEAAGFNVATRTKAGFAEQQIDFFLADVPGELGLWYRLASVTYAGGSLGAGATRNPFHSAALGSALMLGPDAGPYDEEADRLRAARAVRHVQKEDGLAKALIETIAPDRAAKLAERAWDVCFAGATAEARLKDILKTQIAKREAMV